jgi:hypothetical protein
LDLGCTATLITFVNPGNDTANVSCYFFDGNGSLLIPAVQSRTIGAGGWQTCFPATSDELGGVTRGWALLSSDVTILPTVQYEGERARTPGYQTEAYPVDCDDDTGYEFVCQFAQ